MSTSIFRSVSTSGKTSFSESFFFFRRLAAFEETATAGVPASALPLARGGKVVRASAAMPERAATADRARASDDLSNRATSANFAASCPATFRTEVTRPAAECEDKAAARQASTHDEIADCAIGINRRCTLTEVR